jgi:hypothetical protein
MIERVRQKQTIQDQMLELLQDGQPHPMDELHSLCGPSLRGVVPTHICMIRKRLPEGQAILCVLVKRSLHYQLVFLFNPRDSRLKNHSKQSEPAFTR